MGLGFSCSTAINLSTKRDRKQLEKGLQGLNKSQSCKCLQDVGRYEPYKQSLTSLKGILNKHYCQHKTANYIIKWSWYILI